MKGTYRDSRLPVEEVAVLRSSAAVGGRVTAEVAQLLLDSLRHLLECRLLLVVLELQDRRVSERAWDYGNCEKNRDWRKGDSILR